MTVLLPTGPDADIGDALAAGRHGPVPRDLAAFESAFIALVEAGHTDRDLAWDQFYDRTLARVDPAWGSHDDEQGTIASFSRIWARAAGLSLGATVLDVGTCFGFLPLAWAARPGAPRLLALDRSHECAALAARQARRLGLPVASACADGRRLPLADRAVGTVLLLHVLEHVGAATSRALLDEALRVAARRVVVAVPVEDEPDPVFGHVQAFDPGRLAQLGRRSGWWTSMALADGAWLVLDRPDPGQP